MPVIVNEWEKLKELFQKVISMATSETELVFSYQNAFDSTLTFLQKFTDISLSYLLGYFISLEYLELKNYLSKNLRINQIFKLYDDFKEMIFLYIKALVFDLGILLTAQTLVLNLFHVRYAFSLAFGLAVLNIIPYFGSVFGQIIIFFIDYLTTGTFRFSMIMSVFVVQQIESNCLQPILYGKVMHLKPLYIFISILFFGSFMGLIGVLFAPVFAIAIQHFLQHLKQ
ncbi:MAG: AI-2E family transporter [Erysipelotrichaceae bacterium]|nr:AI-2E family transporter [Erysipelotrichaceae bacterium]